MTAAPEHKELRVLFVGLGTSRVGWYRCALPAMYLGADWCGVVGEPPHLHFQTGCVDWATKIPDFGSYDVVIVQQPRGSRWMKLIQSLKERGVTVLVEYDDYVDGIRKSKDHDFKEHFKPEHLRQMQLCRRVSDGMIASTEFLALKYKSDVPAVWVCENGLDMGRYRLTRPRRGHIGEAETVTIMWSGATGHTRGVAPWLRIVWNLMREHENVCFASIGQPFGADLADEFKNRLISVPFAQLETYPAAMMLGDIALAPAGTSTWYRGKSELRAMEAAALGIPVIADKHYANAVIHKHTGFLVDNPGEVQGYLIALIADQSRRHGMGDAARTHAEAAFDMRHRVEQWRVAIAEAWATKNSVEYVLAAA